MITENAIEFFEQRELLFSSMAENSLTEMISLINANGEIIYRTPITQKNNDNGTAKKIHPTERENDHCVPRDQEQAESAFNKAIANPGIPIIYYIDILKSDGSCIYVESSFTNMLHLKDVNAILIIDRDITKTTVAEKKIRESEELFRLLVESVKEYAIFMIDPAGYILSWNLGAEHIIGYSTKEIIGKHFSILYTTEEKNDLLPGEHLRLTKENGRYENLGWRIRKSGSLFWADEMFSALYSESGHLRGYVKVTRDITESKKLEEEVRLLHDELEKKRERRSEESKLAHKELETFSYSVSHDLRAPLRAISGFSMILQEDYSDLLNEEGNRILNKVIANSNRMGVLIDDLLAFSRMGRLDMRSRTVNMQFLVESSIEELLVPGIKERYRISLQQLPTCEGDSSMMKQVWLNLIDNAIKYSSKVAAPHIEIGYCEDEQMHTYFVRDNGVGFDMQYSDKLFGVFQRLHHNDQFEGTGLGLALVQRIIHKHNGNIWADASPGKGAIFSFKLPKQK